MAKVRETIYIVKVSELVRDNEPDKLSGDNNDLISALEQVVQELAGSSVVVEVEKA